VFEWKFRLCSSDNPARPHRPAAYWWEFSKRESLQLRSEWGGPREWLIRRLLKARGKWVTSSLARAARFSSAGESQLHATGSVCVCVCVCVGGGGWWQGGGGGHNIAAGGQWEWGGVKRGVGEGGGGERERRGGHEEGNLREKVRSGRCEKKKKERV